MDAMTTKVRKQWDLVLGNPKEKEPWHSAPDLAWSPDGEHLLVCGLQVDEDVVAMPSAAWNMTWLVSRKGAVIWCEEVGGHTVFWAPDGCSFATSPPPWVRPLDAPRQGEAVATGALLAWSRGVFWTERDKHVEASGDAKGRWKFRGYLQAFDASPTSGAVLGTDKGQLTRLDPDGPGWSRQIRCEPVPGGVGIQRVRHNPAGDRIAVTRRGGRHRDVGIHNAQTGHCVRRLRGLGSWIEDVAWSPDGSMLAVSEGQRNTRIFDTHTWEQIAGWELDEGHLELLRWSPDGKLLAAIQRKWGRYCQHLVVWSVSAPPP